MVKVTNFYAQSIGAHKVFVCFNVDNLADPLSRYTFKLYRSSNYVNWRLIASLVDVIYYVDEKAVPTPNIPLQYKIEVIDNNGQEATIQVPPIVYNSNINDLIARDLARRYSLVLNKKSGIKANYFMTLKGTIRCYKCGNDIIGMPTSSNCPVCHGTGYVKGLHPPIPIFIQFSNRSKKIDKSVPINDEAPGSLIMANYPIAYPKDIVHEFARNRFWQIESVNCLEHRGCVYAQQLMANQLSHSNEMIDAVQSYEGRQDVVSESKRYTGKKTL